MFACAQLITVPSAHTISDHIELEFVIHEAHVSEERERFLETLDYTIDG